MRRQALAGQAEVEEDTGRTPSKRKRGPSTNAAKGKTKSAPAAGNRSKAGRPRKRAEDMSEAEYRRLSAAERRKKKREDTLTSLAVDKQHVLVVLRCYMSFDFTEVTHDAPVEYRALIAALKAKPVLDVYTGEELQVQYGEDEVTTMRELAEQNKVPTTVLLFYLVTE